MGCRNDYLNPNTKERDSKEAAQHLEYALTKLGVSVPVGVSEAARALYGNPSKLDVFVVELCKLCTNMTEAQQNAIIYDGRAAKARSLATWWEIHSAADDARRAQEKREHAMKAAHAGAIAKLTEIEVDAIKKYGFDAHE